MTINRQFRFATGMLMISMALMLLAFSWPAFYPDWGVNLMMLLAGVFASVGFSNLSFRGGKQKPLEQS